MEDNVYNLYSIWVYVISASIALIMLGVAIFQLSRLTSQVEQAIKSNKINQLNTLLSLEQQIAQRRIGLSKASYDLENEVNEMNKVKFDEACQLYLNALDRLCHSATKGILDDDDIRLEYKDIINNTVSDHIDKFNSATEYNNILEAKQRWAKK